MLPPRHCGGPAWPGLPERFVQDFAFRLPAFPDELLSSWLARLAHAHGASAYVFCALHWPGMAIWNRDIDRCAPLDWQQDLAGRLRTDTATIEGATLQPWMSWLAPDRPTARECGNAPTGDLPLVLAAGIFHRSRTRHGLQYCPDCLRTGPPHYRRAWRLGFVVCCALHDRLLDDACPHCGAPVVPHRAPIGGMGFCHACKGDLGDAGEARRPPGMNRAAALQMSLLARLEGAASAAAGSASGMAAGMETASMDTASIGTGSMGPENSAWMQAPEAFTILRSLVAVTTAADFFRRLQDMLGCQNERPGGDALVFEHARTGVRLAWMEMLARWTTDWPVCFVACARDAGITRRSFARHRLPAGLAGLVRQLPDGIQRIRQPWQTILDDALMRRLRRTDKAAWRCLHAQRMLAGMAVMPSDDEAFT